MMKKQLLRGLIVGALAAVGAGISPQALADEGTPSLDLTVNANITAGTCSASVMDGDKTVNEISFSSVYISEIKARTKVKTFKLRFSDCAGLQQKTATVTLASATGSGCGGRSANNAEFANLYDPASDPSPDSGAKAAKTGVEVWTTNSPGVGDSVQFKCNNPKPVNPVTVDLSGASATTPLDYPLSARMVEVSNSTASAITPGKFLAPTVFTIAYQ